MASNTKTKLNTGEITHQNTKKKTFLFLLGTQKAGSTWLNNQLKQSDEFWGSELKEWRLWRQYFKLNKSINFQIDKDLKAPIEDFFHSNSIKAHLTKKERKPCHSSHLFDIFVSLFSFTGMNYNIADRF